MSRDPRHEQTVVHPLGLSDVIEGRWRIEHKLGSGSMGSVFLAWDLEGQQKVAVKILSPELCRKPPFLARFEREARLMARLSHPNLVPLLAVGRRGALPFIVMPHLEGKTLAEHLQSRLGKLAPVEAFDIIQQVCAGLSCLHANRLVHRDVKPQNIFLSPRGHVTLLDLGVARDQEDPGLTRPGVRIGTPYYMAPEQILGQGDVDHRADLYALGAVLFELFTGSPPFLGQSHHEVLRAHRELPPPDASLVSRLVSRAAAHVITQALAKRPDDRFATAEAFRLALEEAYDFSLKSPEEKTATHVMVTTASGEYRPVTGLRPEHAGSSPRPTPPHGSTEETPGTLDTDGGRGSGASEEVLHTGLDLVESSTAAPTHRGTGGSEQETDSDVAEGTLRVIPLLAGVVTSAEVRVDGGMKNRAPLTLSLSQGLHEVEVSRLGYLTVTQKVQVRHGERALLRVELEPGESGSPGRPRRPGGRR